MARDSYAKCRISRLHGVKEHKVTGISMSSKAQTKAAGRARMQKMRKVAMPFKVHGVLC